MSTIPSLADYADLMDELRAEDRMRRARMRPHWCPECRGFDGPGSPCYEEPDEDEPEDDDELEN